MVSRGMITIAAALYQNRTFQLPELATVTFANQCAGAPVRLACGTRLAGGGSAVPYRRKEDLAAITKVSIDLVTNGSPPLLLIGPDVVTPPTCSVRLPRIGQARKWL
jgi:hypothetical protein